MATHEQAHPLKDHLYRLAGAQGGSSPESSPIRADPANDFILTNDDPYWDTFLSHTQNPSEIFTQITLADLRFVRDANRVNFLTLVRVLVHKIISIPSGSSKKNPFPADKRLSRQLLNSVRLLTKVLPALLEEAESHEDTKSLFWSVSYGVGLNSGETNDATVGSFSSSSGIIGRQKYTGNSVGGSSLASGSVEVNIDAAMHSPDSMDVNVGFSKKGECLGVQLLNSLVDLLFWRGFTLENASANLNSESGVDLKIWEMGIGMNGKYGVPNPRLDSNRLEILRLIITLCSRELYLTSKEVVSKGSRFLTVLVSTLPRLKFLTFICSLINLVIRSIKLNDEINGLKASTNVNNRTLRKELATNSLQLLMIMLVYPLPSTDLKFLTDLNIFPISNEYRKPINLVRSYLGKLHKENELNFLYQSIFQFLNKPLEAAIENEASPFNLLKSSNNNNAGANNLTQGNISHLLPWSTQLIMLLWELIQCNKNLKKFIISKKSNELMITLLYYLKYYRTHPKLRMNLIRVISFLFLYLTSDETVIQRLLQPFNNNHYTTKIPAFYRLSNHQNSATNITYRDFIIITVSSMLVNTNEFDDLLTPTFFEYLYNLIPIGVKLEDTKSKATLSYHSCISLMNVISAYAFTSQTLSKDHLKVDLFTLLLRSITNAICRHFKESRTLVYLILKNEKIFRDLLRALEDYKIDSEEVQHHLAENLDGSQTHSSTVSSPIAPSTPQIGTPLQPSTPMNERVESEYDTEDESEQKDQNDNDDGWEVDDAEEYLRAKPPVGMSSKAKSKLPMDVPLITRWPGYKSLTILLKLIKFINEKLELRELNGSFKSNFEIRELLVKIESLKPVLDREFFAYLPSEFDSNKSEFEPLKFHWSELSLGWYSSILWSEAYLSNNIISMKATEQQASNSVSGWFGRRSSTYTIKEVASSWGFNWRSSSSPLSPSNDTKNLSSPASNSPEEYVFEMGILTLNIWHGTAIKLFKIRKDSNIQGHGLSSVGELMKRLKLTSDETPQNGNTVNSPNVSTHGLQTNIGPRGSLSGGSPIQLSPINSRQSFGTPRSSTVGITANDLSRISSRQSFTSNV